MELARAKSLLEDLGKLDPTRVGAARPLFSRAASLLSDNDLVVQNCLTSLSTFDHEWERYREGHEFVRQTMMAALRGIIENDEIKKEMEEEDKHAT